MCGAGILWDFQYVSREQTLLTTIVGKSPLSEKNKTAINDNLGYYEPIHEEYTLAKMLLGVAKLNYEPQSHREAIGHSLVFLKHLERKGFESSSEYNSAIDFFKNRYGQKPTTNFINELKKDGKIKK